MELATVAGGCFWCTEAIFQRLKGVEKVVSGYTGGKRESPTYEQVCAGVTGHAEAIQVTYDPSVVSYKDILQVFFATHDPTSLNKQDYDQGEAYRSAVFYHSEEQKKIAEGLKSKIEGAVTEIIPYSTFYEAEANHQNFYNKNQDAPYCQIIIDPKIQKLYKDFTPLLKDVETN